MVYISSDGRMQDQNTWSFANLKRMFWNFVDGVLLFVQTLIPIGNRQNNRYVTQYRSPSTSSNTLYGSGTQRRIGRPGNTSGISAPPCSAGG